MKLLDIKIFKNIKKLKYKTMSSVLFIKIIIMTNLNKCVSHITMIDYNYITIYNFYLNIINYIYIYIMFFYYKNLDIKSNNINNIKCIVY